MSRGMKNNNIVVWGILMLLMINSSIAAQCHTNPCQLDKDQFFPPNYNCLQVPEQPNIAYCTCPDRQVRHNSPCRICDTVNCGSTGTCIEKIFFPGLFYACACASSTGNYLSPTPCPESTTVLSTTTTTTRTTTTTATTTTMTMMMISCMNGGVYWPLTMSCICPPTFTGRFCETRVDNDLCKNIVCENGGVCNKVPTANNHVEAQCWCLNGFSGSNCELVGIAGRCSMNLCQNGGVCDEQHLGSSIFAYCLCPPGVTGQRCGNRYFNCLQTGLYSDVFNCKYGRYFQCLNSLTTTHLCPKGMRFNSNTKQCESNVVCS